jgi:lysophospholipase L1-like esterase
MTPITLEPNIRGDIARIGADPDTVYSQLVGLKEAVGDREIDALTISIGINDLKIGSDIGFAKLVALCVAVNRCQDQAIDTDINLKTYTVGEEMPDALSALSSLYGHLEQAIRVLFPESQLKSSDIYLVGYPDPFHNESGALCPIFIPRGVAGAGGFENIDGEDEVTWAEQQFFQPLLANEDSAASRAGWTFVNPNSGGDFDTHGYCSTTPRFVRLSDFLGRLSGSSKFNFSGILHPNATGQASISESLYARLHSALFPDGQARKPA